jgi:hypothetical protein
MRVALLAVLLAASGSACTRHIQERQALIDFFDASRLRDTTLLGNMGTARFEPRTDGIVQQFDIEGVERHPQRGAGDQPRDSKDVTVFAQVRTPGGELIPERLVVTFERPAGGRWTITQLRASRISPAASSAPPK